ncbi:hypothetical protein A2U01_0007921 [Trifolium medium]|uniref:Uncharacterized protein n=1 Tax=Trifolium medium TaxID=97028 RepID=A0A392MHR9_9FABA|nr:hypothetical protein [Trifolium medium]
MKRNAKFGKPIPKIPVRRNRQGLAWMNHHVDTTGRWLPVPKDKQDEFLAELRAAGKDRREGKPIDSSRFDKYFPGANSLAKGRKKLYKPRGRANWNVLFRKYKEDMAAPTKAASLKRGSRKSLRLINKRKKEQLLNKF